METNKVCKDCGIKIDIRATRCKTCSSKGKNNGMFIDGHTIKKYYCIDCNKKIT